MRLEGHDKKIDGLHACIEEHARDIVLRIESINKRLDPLETLRAMVLGGAAVVIALIPLLFYLLSRIIPVIEKLKP
jgi:hypothetical protein